METIEFLRDIEDETKYALSLELCYVNARDAVTDVINRMWDDVGGAAADGEQLPADARHKELRHIVFTMGLVITDCADRRRRLANIAAGLPDVVLDEERS